MKQRLTFRYINPALNIGFNIWKEVYFLKPTSVQLYPEVYRGTLIYRAKGSSKRITYTQIKSELKKRESFIEQDVPDWL